MSADSMFHPEHYRENWFQEKRVTVMGLGLFGGGKGVAEFLCRQGAYVTVTDLRSEEELAESVEAMRELPVRFVLGEHVETDFTGADMVVVNPAVPRNAPLLELCRENDVPLETEMNLFFKFCRGRICAVTGSNGKTTTTRMIGAMARRVWPTTRLGGNLGQSLLPEVHEIQENEWVILELSSFQLEDLAALERRPEISLVTNLSPNHLDRHGDYESYVAAKREIMRSSMPGSKAILCGDDAVLRSWAQSCDRDVVFYGRADGQTPQARGVWYQSSGRDGGEVLLAEGDERRTLFDRSHLELRGSFNAVNAAGASAAALEMGVDENQIRAAIREFKPVRHRLELFSTTDGVEYYDDSIATTPESTIAALEAVGPDVWLICGGSSKGCSFSALAQAAARRTKGVLLVGTTADEIASALTAAGLADDAIVHCETLDRAVAEARSRAEPGDRVLLSPACPSYDQFRNFEERGQRFKALTAETLGV